MVGSLDGGGDSFRLVGGGSGFIALHMKVVKFIAWGWGGGAVSLRLLSAPLIWFWWPRVEWSWGKSCWDGRAK